jgi:lipoprotein-releasing system permease protein
MRIDVNFQIARTHLFTRKRQTLVAALGVTIGIGMFIFSKSLTNGFTSYARRNTFKTTAHITVYQEDQVSKPLVSNASLASLPILVNPSITTTSHRLVNPQALIDRFKAERGVLAVAPQVNVEVFYNNGNTQLRGTGNGVRIAEANAMFNIKGDMLAGTLEALSNTQDGIIIGVGIARKLNLQVGENLSVTSALGVIKNMRVVGIFSTSVKAVDESKSYINITAAQQLMRENSSYVTHIYANVSSPDSAEQKAEHLQGLTSYRVEPWQVSNADQLAGDKVRDIMTTFVSITILMVAAFGIYNILNMTISQKLNDIAILKATGFRGRDIVQIFVTEALIMGAIGTLGGNLVGAVLVLILSQVYIGGPVGNFPIQLELGVFVLSTAIGMLITGGAGYLPALKAARVDPVEIFRR